MGRIVPRTPGGIVPKTCCIILMTGIMILKDAVIVLTTGWGRVFKTGGSSRFTTMGDRFGTGN
jgi:hypothetical protein